MGIDYGKVVVNGVLSKDYDLTTIDDTSRSATPTISFNDGYIRIRWSNYDECGIAVGKIDFTRYTTLHIEISGAMGEDYIHTRVFSISSATSYWVSDSDGSGDVIVYKSVGGRTMPKATYEIDVTNVIGEYYLKFCATCWADISDYNIYNIWLSKDSVS